MQKLQKILIKNTWISLLILLVGTLWACRSKNSLSNEDIAILYDKSGYTWENEMYVYNLNDTVVNLYVKIKPKELLFSKIENQYKAKYSIKFELFNDFESEEILDSAFKSYELLNDQRELVEKWDTVAINAKSGQDYVLFVQLEDIFRKHRSYKLIYLKKKDLNSDSYFKLNKLASDSVQINHAQLQDSVVYVNRFKQDTLFPILPFQFDDDLKLEPKPYSIDSLTVDKEGAFSFITEPNEFYLVQTDTIDNEGYAFVNLPKLTITNFHQLIGPLYYLATENEYRKIRSSNNQKLAFEKFWIKHTGTKERARNTIKRYYKEVEKANELFTSTKPGWKTDRGMVYIIYGSPRIVYRTNDSEVWVYGEENNMLSEIFKFKKISNPFNDNTYELERNTNFKSSWYRMTNAWLEGRIY